MNSTSKRIWKPTFPTSMDAGTIDSQSIKRYLKPESDLEDFIMSQPEWIKGTLWGTPRPGHPEGKVLYHLMEVLKNVDVATNCPKTRSTLRLITLVHDSFKHLEEKTRPRTNWTLHHAYIAATFSKEIGLDHSISEVIELHDEAFYCWKDSVFGDEQNALNRLNSLISRLGENLQLYYLFFKCDTKTGNKFQDSLDWFESNAKGIQIVDF
jgi:hypothetical protein